MFEETYEVLKEEIDRYLDSTVPEYAGNLSLITEPMRYSLLSPGKRFRGVLNLLSAESMGGKKEDFLPLAAAIEMIHSFSLVHDDLPAIDNDDFRRGLPTTHVVYGEDIAILAGDALLVEGFRHIAEQLKFSAEVRLKIISELSESISWEGMVGGQSLDVRASKEESCKEFIQEMYELKTAKLFAFSLSSPAIPLRSKNVNGLKRIGIELGIAFQITDDILDEASSGEAIEKPAGSDRRNEKVNMICLTGIEEARGRAVEAYKRARSDLQNIDGDWSRIIEIIDLMERRSK